MIASCTSPPACERVNRIFALQDIVSERRLVCVLIPLTELRHLAFLVDFLGVCDEGTNVLWAVKYAYVGHDFGTSYRDRLMLNCDSIEVPAAQRLSWTPNLSCRIAVLLTTGPTILNEII
jgi:hypothetical protein